MHPPAAAAPARFFAFWRWWLPVAALALLLAIVFVDPFAGDWDALDYTVLALEPRPSSMLLGRMLFIFANHLLWQAAHTFFGLDAAQAYLVFKYFVVLQSPFCIALLWLLAYEFTASPRAATVAALMIAVSPFYVIYSGQAMTEIPSLLLLAAGLTLYTRGVRLRHTPYILIGAALLGAGVNVRELAALYAPWLIISLIVYGRLRSRRDFAVMVAACFVFVFVAFAPFAAWYLFDIQDYRAWWHGWVESTRAETARHPVALSNFRQLFLFFFIAAPIALPLLPFAIVSAWRKRKLQLARARMQRQIQPGGAEHAQVARRFSLSAIHHTLSTISPLLAFGLLGAAANLSLIIHYSVVLNGRYMLTGLPAIAPLVAAFLVRQRSAAFAPNARRAFTYAVLLVMGVSVAVGAIVHHQSAASLDAHRRTGAYLARLRQLPSDAVVVAGAQTVSVNFWRGTGAGAWQTIGTGGGYYGEAWLNETIQDHLRNRRRVFLDADTGVWATRGWQLEETRAVARLSNRFRFRRHAETLYEIRLADDSTATDDPHLERLLPENKRTS